MDRLSSPALTALRELARSDQWTFPLTDGEARVVITTLPGRAVIGVARSGSCLWVLVDAAKPHAHEHLSQLIEQWPFGKVGTPVSSDVSMFDAIRLLTPFVAAEMVGSD